jgi:hypothetical protein
VLPEIPQLEFESALDEIAMRIVESAEIHRPPVDALRVARALGIDVATDDRQLGRARYVRLAGVGGAAARPAILLRPEPRGERRQWAVAHEIGEQAAHDVFARLGVDPREAAAGARETVPNQLAVRMLLPREWFFRDAVACAWDVPTLKRRYASASHELVARRMLDHSLPVIISVYDQDDLSFRRGNLGRRTPPASPLERACRAAAHASGRPCRRKNTTTQVRAWAIHEPGWKREIVRAELHLDPPVDEFDEPA